MKENLKYKAIRTDQRLQFNTLFFSTLLFIGIGSGLSAGTLKIELEFKKIPPRTGILYFPEDGNMSTPHQLVIDQIDKKFTKILGVAMPGSMVVFKNSDSVDHNIYANDMGANVFFDVGLAEPGEESIIRMDWKANTIIRIGCKIHPRMKSYIANIPSRHYKILQFRRNKTKYRVKMKNIPDELSQVKMWLPSYFDVDITLSPGETKVLPLLKRKKRYGRVKLIREPSEPNRTSKAPHVSAISIPGLEEAGRKPRKPISKPNRMVSESQNMDSKPEKLLPEPKPTPDKTIIPFLPEKSTLEPEKPLKKQPKIWSTKQNSSVSESQNIHSESEKLVSDPKNALHKSHILNPKDREPVREPEKPLKKQPKKWFAEPIEPVRKLKK